MGKVVELRSTTVSQTAIASLEALLAKAKCGTVKGWIAVADVEAGHPIAVVCGSFARDAEYAVEAAGRMMDAVCERTGEKKKSVAAAATRPLPRGLSAKRTA